MIIVLGCSQSYFVFLKRFNDSVGNITEKLREKYDTGKPHGKS